MLRISSGTAAKPLFASFWMGGFEGADHINSSGLPLSMCDITQHRMQAAADYARLADFDIRTVRESVGWRLVERRGGYDFTSLLSRARAAQALGLQVIWTLCHYGWPSDVDVLSASFVERFARYARAVATFLAQFSAAAPVYAPINEISFLTWAVCESGRMHPSHAELKGRGAEFKRQLVRAALAACNAIREVDPRARFLHTDPLMRVVAPLGRAELAGAAARQNERQFEAWDMLSGRVEPQLGGDSRYLDLIGVNYYCANQCEMPSGRPLGWQLDDPRRVPLASLLQSVQQRYARPLVIAETSHAGVRRAIWIRDIAIEVKAARHRGVQVEGVCLYPIIDRPDWENTSHWHDCGLWDLELTDGGVLRRRLNGQYAAALREAQQNVVLPAVCRQRESGRTQTPARVIALASRQPDRRAL